MIADGVDSELAGELAAYRQHRRMVWQTIRARYAEAVADAVEAGQHEGDARRTGARAVRGDMRAMMSELLVRAPVPAVLDFLASGGLDWGAAGEQIFERGDVVTRIIEHAHARPTWTNLEFLDSAADDARWSAWSRDWLQTIRGASPAARDMFDEKPAAPAPSAPESASALSQWAPWLATAGAMITLTAAVVATTRE